MHILISVWMDLKHPFERNAQYVESQNDDKFSGICSF